ncbi:16S rRNA (uracil(1498)-N(3))-methyltransferase [Bacillota bacterium]
MNRFFVDKDAVQGDNITLTDKDDIKHISKVLRLDRGGRLEVSDSEEFEYEAEISSIEPSTISLKVIKKQKFQREPATKVTLYQSLPKQGKMEVIIQKCVELGIHAIVPVFTARTVVSERQGFEKKLERWNRVSAEAVKQCKRGIIPKISNSISFAGMVSDIKERQDFDLILFPYEEEKETSIKDVLRSFSGVKRNIAYIIGPEGGFSEDEAEAVIEAGGVAVSLGKTILRTETAGPSALAMIMYELEI